MCDGCFFEFQGCFRVTGKPEVERAKPSGPEVGFEDSKPVSGQLPELPTNQEMVLSVVIGAFTELIKRNYKAFLRLRILGC
jgi:hypothetical protein